MVIDDEEFCISAMKCVLGLLGINTEMHVDFCINGKEALALLKEQIKKGFKYKVIFIDFQMPIMDGKVATKKMRKVLTDEFKIDIKDQPVILGVTGHVLEKAKEEGIEAGMNDILTKPLNIDTLKDQLLKHQIIID